MASTVTVHIDTGRGLVGERLVGERLGGKGGEKERRANDAEDVLFVVGGSGGGTSLSGDDGRAGTPCSNTGACPAMTIEAGRGGRGGTTGAMLLLLCFGCLWRRDSRREGRSGGVVFLADARPPETGSRTGRCVRLDFAGGGLTLWTSLSERNTSES